MRNCSSGRTRGVLLTRPLYRRNNSQEWLRSRMPPKETKEDIPDGMDALTPERAEEVASVIAEQWRRDWGAILDLVVAKTGISRSDAFQFMVLRELAQVRYGVE